MMGTLKRAMTVIAGSAMVFSGTAAAEALLETADLGSVATYAAMSQDEGAGLEEQAEPQGWTEGWESTAEVGLNGSSGNTERFNVRAAAQMDRFVGDEESRLRFTYTYANEDSQVTEQKFRASARHDHLYDGTPWRAFGQGVYDYDQFQDWNHRVSLRAGGGYQFIETEKTDFLGRFGFAATKDLQGSNTAWRPEALAGLEYKQQITAKQSFEFYVDFFLDLSDTGPYRIEGRAEYAILLDEESNLSLKIGIEDRYDSQPGSANRNDVDYYALLSWTF